MSDEFDVVPKLGRIGQQGARSGKSTLDRLKRAATRRKATGAPARRTGFTGQRFGRGAGVGALSKSRVFSKARRAVVKVHIARGGASGTAGFAKHVSYIGRDGTERDGSASALYDRQNNIADADAFAARGEDDERQFRIIVSPEDGHDLEDMKETTRALMAQVERDLGETLDWIAADHHNTAHPHTHIVIRGRAGDDALVIAKDYVTHGLRARAQEILTNELGQRREKDIARGQLREATRNGLTSIDRVLSDKAHEDRVHVAPALGSGARFDRRLERARLRHLQSLGLAQPVGDAAWQLAPDWKATLKALGKQGDIIRTLSSQLGTAARASSIQKIDGAVEAVWGEVRAVGPGDELRNGRVIVLQDPQGQLWSFDASETEMQNLPARGGIIALSPRPPALKPADRIIFGIAQANDGVYSETLHAAADPGSTREFRLAHTRRLEALRRAGLVQRSQDGRWSIPGDFERLILEHEKKQNGTEKQVRSWLPLDALVRHPDAGLLDQLEPVFETAEGEFGKRLQAAQLARQQWLVENGYLADAGSWLSPEQMSDMQMKARRAALLDAAAAAKRRPVSLEETGKFIGKYTGHVDLPQGRFAIVQSTSALTFAPYRKGLGAHRGKVIAVTLRAQRLTWQLQRRRGLTR
jgi:type IV secretory pathway VirD2 relaxase